VRLRAVASRGVRFTALAAFWTTAIQVGSLLVLARLLSPSDFGVVAMMAVVFGLADMLAQMGIADGIIQHPQSLSTAQLSTLFWTNCALGAAAYLLIQLSIPLLVAVYREPALGRLVPIASIPIAITPLGIHIAAQLRKAFRFRLLAAVDVCKAATGAGIAIVAALLGWGVWALVAGQLSAAAIGVLALLAIGWKERWLPRFTIDFASVRGILTFGAYYFGSNVVNYLNSRIDHLLIGSLLGARELGYYSIAFNLALQVAGRVNQVIGHVAFPVMATLRSDKAQLNRWYLKMLNILATVNAPILLGLAAVAPLFVPLVLGVKWQPAVPLLQVLSALVLLRSAGSAGGTLTYALGRAQVSFHWNLALLLVIPASVYLGARMGGTPGVALALAIAQGALFLGWYAVARLLVGSGFAEYAGHFLRPVAVALAMALLVSQLRSMLAGGSAPALLLALVLLGAAVYVAAYRILFRESFAEYLRLAREASASR
jgi:lipopolysaccharide exporter